ncbi:MAG: DUF4236 domain-containing protein [Acidobacteria bacterium]|nr:DUF4236 domain-containing protein [Acidobacteriota bacterium]
MGFFFRKSINFGPLRLNFSKSGIGVSTGFKGFRVGTGPRGGYVNIGGGGLYYRASLPGRSRRANTGSHNSRSLATPLLESIDSVDVANMVDSSSAEILAHINKQLRKLDPTIPIVIVTAVAAYYAIAFRASDLVFLTILFAGIGLSCLSYVKLRRGRIVKIIYELRPEFEPVWARLVAALGRAGECSRIWHIESISSDGTSTHRRPTLIRFTSPPGISTEIPINAIRVGRQTLFFCPDRILVHDRNRYGAVGYHELVIRSSALSFTETESLPADAEITGYRWLHETRSGEPDRRYRENLRLPVCRYGMLEMSSLSGLREWIMFSNSERARELSLALEEMRRVIPTIQ